jgi:Gpi18-like mannosyltransferase
MPAGMIVTTLAIGFWILINLQKKYQLTHELILFMSLISTAITPFLLPKMHDRYFYPADVFSLILAFYTPQFWFVPIAYQMVSGLAYSIFLFDAPRSTVLVLATEINTLVIAYLIWEHFKQLNTGEKTTS